jgi:hypothetical protein
VVWFLGREAESRRAAKTGSSLTRPPKEKGLSCPILGGDLVDQVTAELPPSR